MGFIYLNYFSFTIPKTLDKVYILPKIFSYSVSLLADLAFWDWTVMSC